ncbi:MAG: isoprenyl transferase [Calditrichia bacterium]
MSKTSKKLEELNKLLESGNSLPNHVAIIMDGNGRWAKRRGLPRVAGHREGVKSVRTIVEACGELGIKYLTLYTFSKENWRRPKSEVSALMRLLISTLKKELSELHKKNVRLLAIGQLQDLPSAVYQELVDAIEYTRYNTGLTLTLALSYSGRQEIVDAIREMARAVQNGTLLPEEIDSQVISSFLYTSQIPDPDLLIRTSGEMRISNFLLYQIAYTEIVVTKTLWPGFRRSEFFDALIHYMQRERRFGMVSEQVRPLKTATK